MVAGRINLIEISLVSSKDRLSRLSNSSHTSGANRVKPVKPRSKPFNFFMTMKDSRDGRDVRTLKPRSKPFNLFKTMKDSRDGRDVRTLKARSSFSRLDIRLMYGQAGSELRLLWLRSTILTIANFSKIVPRPRRSFVLSGRRSPIRNLPVEKIFVTHSALETRHTADDGWGNVEEIVDLSDPRQI